MSGLCCVAKNTVSRGGLVIIASDAFGLCHKMLITP